MKTQTFEVVNLRGMDQRWVPDLTSAMLIQDMSWDPKDSWRECGGFDLIGYVKKSTIFDQEGTEENPTNTEDSNTGQWSLADYLQDRLEEISGTGSSDTQGKGKDTEGAPSTPDELDPVGGDLTVAGTPPLTRDTYGSWDRRKNGWAGETQIASIHWFCQHNGARQFLVWEEKAPFDEWDGARVSDRGSLKIFWGSYAPEAHPAKTVQSLAFSSSSLVEQPLYNDVDRRVISDSGYRTQSAVWGGRLYLVNGFNEPLVFNGTVAERAGFNVPPPAPTVTSADWYHSNSVLYDDGSYDGLAVPTNETNDTANWEQLDFFGLGPLSDGVPYNNDGSAISGNLSDDIIQFLTFWCHEQDDSGQTDRRRVGYQYKITYVNERGQESEASGPSSLVTWKNGSGPNAAHGAGFVYLNLAQGPPECVARRVYRTRNIYDYDGNLVTRGIGKAFYFLDEIQDNITDTYVDGAPDSHLGSLLNESSLGRFPGGSKFIASFKNTMFVAGHAGNVVHYSAPLKPEVFPEDNELHIGEADGGQITGLYATKNALVVFKTRGIYLIKGNPSTGFNAQTLNADTGCVAPDSLAELPGLGLAFLSEKSVMLLKGALENSGTPTEIVNISTPIPDLMERVSSSSAMQAVGVVHASEKEYILAVPTDGKSKNNTVYVFHYEVGAWSVRPNWPMECATISQDHRGYVFFGSSNTASMPGIYTISRWWPYKGPTFDFADGVTTPDYVFSPFVRPYYSTTSIAFGTGSSRGGHYESVHPGHVMLYTVANGDNPVTLNYRANRSLKDVRESRQEADQQDPMDRFAVYGKSSLDGGELWGKHRPTVVRFDVSTTQVGPVKEFEFSVSNNSGFRDDITLDSFGSNSFKSPRLELVGYDIEIKVGEQRSIKPLNEALGPGRR